MPRRSAEQSPIVKSDGEQIRTRREWLGLTQTELAEMAGVHRDTISALEAGKGVRQATVVAVMRSLDEHEAEVGKHAPGRSEALPPGVHRIGDPADDLIEFEIEGNFGVRAVVRGPVRDIDALQDAVKKLIAGMQSPEAPRSGGDHRPDGT